MTRVVVLTGGTYGDVMPYVGLGVRLKDSGLRVSVAAAERFRDLVTDAGLDFRALAGFDPREAASSAAGEAASRPGARGTMSLFRLAVDGLRAQVPSMKAAVEDADVVLCTYATVVLAVPIAEARGASCLVAPLQIAEPSRELGSGFVGGRNLGPWLNKAVPTLMNRLGTRLFGGLVGQLRSGLGLPPQPGPGYRSEELTVLHGVSPVVVPRPADWRDGVRLVGYWWPPRPPAWQPPAELVDFLAAGPPPVYIGFGSNTDQSTSGLGPILSEALRRARHRAIVHRGWADLDVTGGDVLAVDDVPHDWLFPRMAAVVHHAGAGTAAAGLRAGVPAVPVPAVHDQPFWARRLVALGVAPRALRASRLRADRLTAALTAAVEVPGYRQAASAIADRLRQEDGAAGVLDAISLVSAAWQ